MKKFFKILISAVITVVLLYFLLAQFDIKKLIDVLSKANLIFLFGAFLLYLSLIFIRTLRFRILLKKSLSFLEMFPIICKHTFFKVILPFKIGELSFVYMLRKKKHSIGKSLSSLIVARIFDFFIMTFVFIMMIIFSYNIDTNLFSNIIPYALLLSVALVFALLIMLFFPDFIIKILNKVNLKKLSHLVSPFKEIRSRSILTKTFFMSTLHYIVSMVSTYLIMLSVGFNLPLNIFVITITLSTLSGFLPINGIAGLGTVEAVIALVLSSFGYSTAESIILGFSIHIIQIFFVVAVGAIGWLFPTNHHEIRS